MQAPLSNHFKRRLQRRIIYQGIPDKTFSLGKEVPKMRITFAIFECWIEWNDDGINPDFHAVIESRDNWQNGFRLINFQTSPKVLLPKWQFHAIDESEKQIIEC